MAAAVSDYRILTAGDTAIVVEFGDSIDRGLNATVLALARRLDESHLPGLVETVPTFRSLTVFYEPVALSRAALEVRAHDVPFMIEHGQRVCKLTFERMLEQPTTLYGSERSSNYQGQIEALGKHFARRPQAPRTE